jgi:hypothetical protein
VHFLVSGCTYHAICAARLLSGIKMEGKQSILFKDGTVRRFRCAFLSFAAETFIFPEHSMDIIRDME